MSLPNRPCAIPPVRLVWRRRFCINMIPKPNMAVVTADQILEPKETFQLAMQSALSFVNENPEALVTFGIKPTFPSTQLGYVKFGETISV